MCIFPFSHISLNYKHFPLQTKLKNLPFFFVRKANMPTSNSPTQKPGILIRKVHRSALTRSGKRETKQIIHQNKHFFLLPLLTRQHIHDSLARHNTLNCSQAAKGHGKQIIHETSFLATKHTKWQNVSFFYLSFLST